ncbi:1-acyl-sn-glycerol-3-phosphate acyltransferase [candidate division KSB1 bacterium]|nr:1-acyl-sn-glycerol-3-phosphate acyltransferase [candidate division KSB1 bacterium]
MAFRLKNKTPDAGILYRGLWILCNLILALLFRLKAEGKENIPAKGPVIFVANHQCYLDPFFVGAKTKRLVQFMTTAEVYRQPLIRAFLNIVGAFPKRKFVMDISAQRHALRILQKGGAVGIFPEGERSWDSRPLSLLDGAIKMLALAQVSVVPVCITGSYQVYPRWATFPRLAPVRVRFFKPLRVDRNTPIGKAKNRLSRKIHQGHTKPVKTYGPSPANFLPYLMWYCPLCRQIDCLVVLKSKRIYCLRCSSLWGLDRFYYLKLIKGEKKYLGKRMPIPEWMDLYHPLNHLHPLDEKVPMKEENESVYLKSKRVHFSKGGFPTLYHVGEGFLCLTDGGLIFYDEGTGERIPFELIRSANIEGNRKLQLGTRRGELFQFIFRDESALKWQLAIALGKKGNIRSHNSY